MTCSPTTTDFSDRTPCVWPLYLVFFACVIGAAAFSTYAVLTRNLGLLTLVVAGWPLPFFTLTAVFCLVRWRWWNRARREAPAEKRRGPSTEEPWVIPPSVMLFAVVAAVATSYSIIAHDRETFWAIGAVSVAGALALMYSANFNRCDRISRRILRIDQAKPVPAALVAEGHRVVALILTTAILWSAFERLRAEIILRLGTDFWIRP